MVPQDPRYRYRVRQTDVILAPNQPPPPVEHDVVYEEEGRPQEEQEYVALDDQQVNHPSGYQMRSRSHNRSRFEAFDKEEDDDEEEALETLWLPSIPTIPEPAGNHERIIEDDRNQDREDSSTTDNSDGVVTIDESDEELLQEAGNNREQEQGQEQDIQVEDNHS